MQIPSDLGAFVRDALNKGHSKNEIAQSLKRSSWTDQEIDQALAAWSLDEKLGAVPQPARSTTAWDALFYALLFSAFGMVVGNILTLTFGQITLWLPEEGDAQSASGLRGLRWSMAALIVFTPAFLWLHHRDVRASLANPASKYGAVRRWLSALAIFVAAIALLGDGIYLIYRFLDGELFVAKSVAVALMALVVVQYFRQDRQEEESASARGRLIAKYLSPALAALVLALSFSTIGGPMQGQIEYHDRLRISDTRNLANDVAICMAKQEGDLPKTLDPMTCVRNPHRLSGYAVGITYERLSEKYFHLCIELEEPKRASFYSGNLKGNLFCVGEHVN